MRDKQTIIGLAILAYALLTVWIMTGIADAFEVTVNGTNITVSYTEPATNEDGSPLLDLSHTTIYLDIIGDGDSESAVKEVPASSKVGGGEIAAEIIVPNLDVNETAIELWATASDFVGNESGKSNILRLEAAEIDQLAPAPPQ